MVLNYRRAPGVLVQYSHICRQGPITYPKFAANRVAERVIVAVERQRAAIDSSRRPDMELADSEMIRILLDPKRGEQSSVAGSMPQRGCAMKPQTPIRRKIRCKCGRCRQCIENARWERIFAEKFADPDYYSRPMTHIASPLESL